jgi:hypothetical protein
MVISALRPCFRLTMRPAIRRTMETGTRSALDNAQFGLTFVGLGTGIAGVVVSSVAVAVFGLLLCALGLAYFALEKSREG